MDLCATIAKNIADRVEAESLKQNVPVAVTVIDIHGNVVLTHRTMERPPSPSSSPSERPTRPLSPACVLLTSFPSCNQAHPSIPSLPSPAGYTPLMGGGVPLTNVGARRSPASELAAQRREDVAMVETAAINPNPPGPTGPSAARVPVGYTEQKARVGDVGIDYAIGGSGPTLVLLHGYPQTWYEWRHFMPALAKHYTVIAPSLRGAGRSDAPPTVTRRRPWPPIFTACSSRSATDRHPPGRP